MLIHQKDGPVRQIASEATTVRFRLRAYPMTVTTTHRGRCRARRLTYAQAATACHSLVSRVLWRADKPRRPRDRTVSSFFEFSFFEFCFNHSAQSWTDIASSLSGRWRGPMSRLISAKPSDRSAALTSLRSGPAGTYGPAGPPQLAACFIARIEMRGPARQPIPQ
jgi:hypothetical protein